MARYSFYSFLLCAALILATAFLYYPKWKQSGTEATISWDVSGYYLYLPASLIYKDLKHVDFFPQIERKYSPGPGMGQAFKDEKSGNYIMKYSVGQALQFLPWFTLAHVAAGPLGFPADGFSSPYQYAISWGSLLIALLGLWLARSNLLRFFSDKSVALALLAMVWGSNYLNYTAIDGAMTHNWLFTLYNILIYSTIKYHEKPSVKWAALIGISCGWATLTRPTEIITVLIPLLWNVGNLSELKSRISFFREHKMTVLVAKLLCIAIIAIQPLYWKWASGHWIVYSYQDQGFDWKHPHFADVFFSFRCGWFIYSPMMLLAVFGLIPFWKQQKGLFPSIGLFLLLFTYITCAWSIWWYGGSFGARAMVQSYAFWLFPMAALAQWILSKRWLSIGFGILCCFFIWHSLWWTHQAHRGGMYLVEQMTNRYFWKVYGKEKADPDWLMFLDKPDNFRGSSRQDIETIWQNNFETDTLQTTSNQPIAGSRSLFMDGSTTYSPKYIIPRPKPDTWLRLWFTARSAEKENEIWRMPQAIVAFRNGDVVVKDNMIRVQRLLRGSEPQRMYMDIKQPRKPYDKIELNFWNPGSATKLYIDDLSVEQFR